MSKQLVRPEDLKDLKKLIKDFKPEIGLFESRIFIPQVIGRLDYLLDIFSEFRVLTEDEQTAILIDGAVRSIVDPRRVDVRAPEPAVGRQYLEMIRTLIDDQFIEPIQDLKQRYPVDELINGDIDQLIAFLNEAKLIFESIFGVREKMFTMAFRPLINIRNTRTGEILYGPTDALSIILVPFETRLGELINVAQTTSESIRLWSEKLKDQHLKHVEMISDLAQITVAKEQTRATRLNIWVQVAVVVLAITLAILSQPLGTYMEKKILESALIKNQMDTDKCREMHEAFRKQSIDDMERINRQLGECQTKKRK